MYLATYFFSVHKHIVRQLITYIKEKLEQTVTLKDTNQKDK